MDIDRTMIKALSADARIEILQSLMRRRKMPSELAKVLGLAPSTIVEHLKTLEAAGLVQRKETGHKWIYYEITDKGLNLVEPKTPIRFVFVLLLGLGIAAFGALNYIANGAQQAASGIMQKTQNAPAGELAQDAAAQAGRIAAEPVDVLSIILMALGVVVIIAGIVKIARARKRGKISV